MHHESGHGFPMRSGPRGGDSGFLKRTCDRTSGTPIPEWSEALRCDVWKWFSTWTCWTSRQVALTEQLHGTQFSCWNRFGFLTLSPYPNSNYFRFWSHRPLVNSAAWSTVIFRPIQSWCTLNETFWWLLNLKSCFFILFIFQLSTNLLPMIRSSAEVSF